MSEILKDRPISSEEIEEHRSSNRLLILVLGILLVFGELIWVGQRSYRELTTPTLQLQAMFSLLRYAGVPKEERPAFLDDLNQQKITIWPPTGIWLEPGATDLIEKIKYVLQHSYEEEYNTLDPSEKDTLLNYTLVSVKDDLVSQMRHQQFPDLQEWVNAVQKKDELFLKQNIGYVGFTRYQWHGSQKSLYYLLVPNKEITVYRLYFSSVSDVADKLRFLNALMLPGLCLLLTTALLLTFNFLKYREQNKLLNSQNKIRESHSWEELIQSLFEIMSTYRKIECSSCALQMFHGDYFSMLVVGQEHMKNFERLQPLQEDSITVQRLQHLKVHPSDMFELSTSRNLKKGKYALCVPLLKGDHVVAFINLNFTKVPSTSKICVLLYHLSHHIYESANKIRSQFEEQQEQTQAHYQQWLEEQSDQHVGDLFETLGKKLLKDSLQPQSFLLPTTGVYGFNWNNSEITPLFTNQNSVLSESIPGLIPSLEKQCIKRYAPLYSDQGTPYLLFPLDLALSKQAGEQSFVLLASESHTHLTQMGLHFLHTLFTELARQINYYSQKTCRVYAHDEAVRLATGLQEEVEELLHFKVEQFFQNKQHTLLSRESIILKTQEFMEYQSHFQSQGYGVLIEVDLSQSVELKTNVQHKEDAKRALSFYESSIQKMNEASLASFRTEGKKFVMPLPSGGDGDGIRFFVTSENSRICNGEHIPAGSPILEAEQKSVEKNLLYHFMEILCCAYRSSIPMKFGGILLESERPLQLSLERGEIKIHSYLGGFVEQARFTKGFRLLESGEQEEHLALRRYSEGSSQDFEILNVPKRVYQPWTVILPAILLPEIQEVISSFPCSYSIFQTENFVETEQKTRAYVEIKLHAAHPFHRFIPFLSRQPLSWTLHQNKEALNKLQSFQNKHHSDFENSPALLQEFCRQEQLILTDLQNFLSPVSHEVHLKGLYMRLNQQQLSDIPPKSLDTLITSAQSALLPQLEVSCHYAQILTKLEESYTQGSTPQQCAKILKDINQIFQEYWEVSQELRV